MEPSTLEAPLLQWYDAHRRDLPWRRRVHPYRTWVSEIMLQQTRVEAVLDAYRRFLERFPTLEELGRAELEEVLGLWSGLGYYRRARLLHAGARYVLEEHGGEIPRDRKALLAVPGIGPYTAGAILSIAFGIVTPLVDGNVERVLTRVRGLRGNPRAAPLKGQLWSLAEELVARERPGDWNQALMELGALVCLPRGARCSRCPWEEACVARDQDLVEVLPELPARKASRPQRLVCAVVPAPGDSLLPTPLTPGEIQADLTLLCLRRGEGERLMPGLWEFPTIEPSPGADPNESLSRMIRERTGLEVEIQEELTRVRHSILDRRILLEARAARVVSSKPVSQGEDWAFLAPVARGARGFSSMYTKLTRKLGQGGDPDS